MELGGLAGNRGQEELARERSERRCRRGFRRRISGRLASARAVKQRSRSESGEGEPATRPRCGPPARPHAARNPGRASLSFHSGGQAGAEPGFGASRRPSAPDMESVGVSRAN